MNYLILQNFKCPENMTGQSAKILNMREKQKIPINGGRPVYAEKICFSFSRTHMEGPPALVMQYNVVYSNKGTLYINYI